MYRIQVYVNGRWFDLTNSEGMVYLYQDELEAYQIKDICYPIEYSHIARVKRGK